MKKFIGITFIGLAIGSAAMSQENLSFGGTAGFGHTWLSNSENAKYQPSGNLGLTMIYSTESNWGFGADVKWSIEGGKEKDNSTTFTSKLNYVRVPVRAIYFFGERGQSIRPKVSLGPSVGVLIGGKREIKNNSTGSITKLKAKDYAKQADFGLNASAGLNYHLVEDIWLNLDLNYYHGLTNVWESSLANQKNRNLGINVGVTFGIGKVTKSEIQ